MFKRIVLKRKMNVESIFPISRLFWPELRITLNFNWSMRRPLKRRIILLVHAFQTLIPNIFQETHNYTRVKSYDERP